MPGISRVYHIAQRYIIQILNASFVCQDKGRFFRILGTKPAKIGIFRFQSGQAAAAELVFCYQSLKMPENAGVLFAFLCSAKK